MLDGYQNHSNKARGEYNSDDVLWFGREKIEFAHNIVVKRRKLGQKSVKNTEF